MDDSSLKSGKCPKCNSEEVYTDTIYTKSSERMSIHITGWVLMYFDIYICTNCGWFEEFVSEKDMNDPNTIDKIKKNWKKVK